MAYHGLGLAEAVFAATPRRFSQLLRTVLQDLSERFREREAVRPSLTAIEDRL